MSVKPSSVAPGPVCIARQEVRQDVWREPALTAIRSDAGADADDRLAWLLVRMWALASGRTLRADVPPDELTEDELIGFWADDFAPPNGRHAAPQVAH